MVSSCLRLANCAVIRPPPVTARDLDLLEALDRCPLTARQLLTLSETFSLPFTGERKVRARLQALAGAERVRCWPLTLAGRGAANYYTLSRSGFRLLYGPDALPSAKRSFGPVAVARQHHAHALADFVVHTLVAAHRSRLRLTGFCREGSVRLTAGQEALYPDCAFQIVTPEGTELRFFVELDNRSERIRSDKDVDSWERKIRLYEAFQDTCAKRFRVLVVATRDGARVRHILEAATALARNPDRSLFYGVGLARYIAATDSLRWPCFLDHRSRPVALVPGGERRRVVVREQVAHSAALLDPLLH